jgi:CDP-6-deoxy-D-xylo-4-hexulose-3-dehydrase
MKVAGVRIVDELPDAETGWFGVPIICEDNNLKSKLVSHLESHKIQTRNYFAGNILLHPGYKHLDDFKKYPKANQTLEKVFFLGCSPTITKEMIDYIGRVVEKFVC